MRITIKRKLHKLKDTTNTVEKSHTEEHLYGRKHPIKTIQWMGAKVPLPFVVDRQ